MHNKKSWGTSISLPKPENFTAKECVMYQFSENLLYPTNECFI